jgi:hypothetical protein
MPQASDEQRNLMEKWFGDAIDMRGPYAFLKARGYGDYRGMLIKPTLSHTVSEYEWECIAFLCDEWDFGFEPRITQPRNYEEEVLAEYSTPGLQRNRLEW